MGLYSEEMTDIVVLHKYVQAQLDRFLDCKDNPHIRSNHPRNLSSNPNMEKIDCYFLCKDCIHYHHHQTNRFLGVQQNLSTRLFALVIFLHECIAIHAMVCPDRRLGNHRPVFSISLQYDIHAQPSCSDGYR